jgi:hypothetical protein
MVYSRICLVAIQTSRLLTVLWDVTPCSLLDPDQCFGRTSNLHLQAVLVHDVTLQKAVIFIVIAVRTSRSQTKPHGLLSSMEGRLVQSESKRTIMQMLILDSCVTE